MMRAEWTSDLMGASELLSSWLTTRTRFFQMSICCRRSSRSARHSAGESISSPTADAARSASGHVSCGLNVRTTPSTVADEIQAVARPSNQTQET